MDLQAINAEEFLRQREPRSHLNFHIRAYTYAEVLEVMEGYRARLQQGVPPDREIAARRYAERVNQTLIGGGDYRRVLEAAYLAGCQIGLPGVPHEPEKEPMTTTRKCLARGCGKPRTTGDYCEHHSQSERADLVASITEIVRDADQDFQRVGGSSRHWVRECFLPKLNQGGWILFRKTSCVEARESDPLAVQGVPPPPEPASGPTAGTCDCGRPLVNMCLSCVEEDIEAAKLGEPAETAPPEPELSTLTSIAKEFREAERVTLLIAENIQSRIDGGYAFENDLELVAHYRERAKYHQIRAQAVETLARSAPSGRSQETAEPSNEGVRQLRGQWADKDCTDWTCPMCGRGANYKPDTECDECGFDVTSYIAVESPRGPVQTSAGALATLDNMFEAKMIPAASCTCWVGTDPDGPLPLTTCGECAVHGERARRFDSGGPVQASPEQEAP